MGPECPNTVLFVTRDMLGETGRSYFSIGITLTLPLFNGHRQDKAVSAPSATRSDQDREASYPTVPFEWPSWKTASAYLLRP